MGYKQRRDKNDSKISKQLEGKLTIAEMWKAAGEMGLEVGGQNEEFIVGHVKYDMLIIQEEKMTCGN